MRLAMHWFWLATTAWSILASLPAMSETPTAVISEKVKPAPTPEVVVKGKRAEVSDRIDRRVYDIKNDPDSQTGTAGDVLNKLPSVTVTPTGKVALRGDTNVTVLIDGKYPINGNAVTQTLSAADIDRVEVMTNPSAQYAPDGTSGIINIITKKRHPFGLSGNTNIRINTLGQSGADGTATLTTGPWSFTGQLHANTYLFHFSQTNDRDFPDPSKSASKDHAEGNGLGGETDVSYKLGDRQTLTFDAEHFTGWFENAGTGSYRSATKNYDFKSHNTNRNMSAYVELIYDYNNDKTGGHFTLDSWHADYKSFNNQSQDQSYLLPGYVAAVYGNRSRYSQPEDDIKGDYERHLSSGDEVTTGFEWNRRRNDNTQVYTDSGTIAGPYVNGFTRAFTGDRSLLSGYLTYQRPLFAGWIMLPGIRLESEDIHLRAQDGPVRTGTTRLYPSLHLTHDLGEGKLKLSYSRRVMRPDLTQYDPTIIYWTTLSATQGNPDLKPPETDSLEAGYDCTKSDISYDATLYYRVTENNLSSFSSDIGNGVILTRDINSGRSRSAGVELTEKHPLSKMWKYSVNANLFYVQLTSFSGAINANQMNLTYSGNAMLEYDNATGDQVQANLAVTGRQPNVQGYVKANSHVDLTWRHPLTKKVSLVIVATDLFKGMSSTTVVDTHDLKSVSYRDANDQSLRVSLSYKFGVNK